jgi:tetratricopeptide (TPR) repeat protein
MTGELSPAERLVEEGRAYSQAGDAVAAEKAYRAAIELEPRWPVPLYNLGLLYKYQGRWKESFDCNHGAAALAPDDQAAWWNLGIAATALGRWSDARHAWTECGIKDPGGDDPPDYKFGRTAIRLDPDGNGEVVWGSRLDPARVRLTNIPLPSSAYRWGDIVLHDGAVEGHRVIAGVTYPVFNVLQRLVPSAVHTFIVELASVDDAAVEALEDLAASHGGAAENWGTTTRILCRECSFGTPHEHTDRRAAPAHPHCGLVVPMRDLARVVLDQWLDTTSSADLVRWYEHTPAPGESD